MLKAAAEIIVEEGLQSLSVREITDRAGVSRTLFYSHFGDIDKAVDLLSGHAAEAVEQVFLELYDVSERGAERFAVSTRYIVESALFSPRWGTLMFRVLGARRGIAPAYNERVSEEARAAIKAGDFTISVHEVDAFVTLAAGTTLSLIRRATAGEVNRRTITYAIKMLLCAAGMPAAKSKVLAERRSEGQALPPENWRDV